MAGRGRIEQLISAVLTLDGAVTVDALARVLEEERAVPPGTGAERAREGLRRYASRHDLRHVKLGAERIYARRDTDDNDLRAAFQSSLLRRVRSDPGGLGLAMKACACVLPHLVQRTFSYEEGYLFRRTRPERAALGVETRRVFSRGLEMLESLGYLRLFEVGGQRYAASANLDKGSVFERHLMGVALDAARERLEHEMDRLGLIEPLE